MYQYTNIPIFNIAMYKKSKNCSQNCNNGKTLKFFNIQVLTHIADKIER